MKPAKANRKTVSKKSKTAAKPKSVKSKETAKELIEESNLLLTLINNLPDLIYVKDIQGCKIVSNTADWQASGGKRMEDVIGKTDFDTYPAELATQFWADDKMVLDSGKPVINREEPGRDSQGNPIWRLTTKVPLRDDNGQVVGLVGIGRDITGRKRVEEGLRVSEAQLSGLFAAMNDVVIVFDRTGKYISIAPTHPDLLIKPSEELIGKTLYDVFPKSEAESFSKDILAVLETRKIRQVEYSLPISDQTTWFTATISPMQEDTVLWVAHDITRRKRVEEELVKEQYDMQALMNYLPTYIYFKNRTSHFTRISKSQALRFGLNDPAQAIGKTDFDFFTTEHAQQAYEDEQDIIRTGQPLIKEEKETWTDRPDKWVSTTKMPMRDDASNIIGTFGISTDITERKRVEEELVREKKFLEALNLNSPVAIVVLDNDGRICPATLPLKNYLAIRMRKSSELCSTRLLLQMKRLLKPNNIQSKSCILPCMPSANEDARMARWWMSKFSVRPYWWREKRSPRLPSIMIFPNSCAPAAKLRMPTVPKVNFSQI